MFSNKISEILWIFFNIVYDYNKVYDWKKKFFDAFAKADSNLSISDIRNLENELYAMESIGESLKRIILEVRRGKNQVYRSHENQHQIKITN